MFKLWADAEDDIPTPEVTSNEDGTKTVVSYRQNAKGQRVRITQIIKEVKVKEKVHPLIAARRGWAKYGKEKHTPPGPDTRTTQLGEKVELKLAMLWREQEKKEQEEKMEQKANVVTLQRIRCRTCGGEHYTAKCPYKDTLGADAAAKAPEPEWGNKYVPVHLRPNAPTREARDDLCTLRVLQLNTAIVTEDMLERELFARFGPLQRVALIRDRETRESKGFAYITFETETKARNALEELNGKGYHNLILQMEWLKRKKPGT